MKLSHLRSDQVRERLWEGVRNWRDASEANRLKEPGSSWARYSGLASVIASVGFFFFFLQGFAGPLVYFLIIAGMGSLAASLWVFRRNYWHGKEVCHLVPIRNHQLLGLIRREVLLQAGGAILLAGLMASVSVEGKWDLLGFIKSTLGSLGFAGLFVSLICLLPWPWIRNLWIIPLAAFFMRGFLAGKPVVEMISAWFMNQEYLHFWEEGAASWLGVGGLLMAGMVSFVFWWSRGIFTVPLDRHRYYESNGDSFYDEGADLGGDQRGVEILVPVIGNHREPVGFLEKVIWRFFSPIERTTARVSGFCEEGLLGGMVKRIASVIGLILLLQLDSVFPETLRVVGASVGAMFVAIWTIGLLKGTCSTYLQALRIGPQSYGPAFHALPLCFRTMLGVSWKESLVRIPAVALVLPLVPVVNAEAITGEASSLNSFIWVLTATLLWGAVIFYGSFWNQALSSFSRQITPVTRIFGLGGFLCYLGMLLPLLMFSKIIKAFLGGEVPWGVLGIFVPAIVFVAIGGRVAWMRLSDQTRDLVKS